MPPRRETTRVIELGLRIFKSVVQAQIFLITHTAVYKLFNLKRHMISSRNYLYFRKSVSVSREKL